jgi:hypothetical protein
VLSLFPERPWRKLALGWASLARQHFVTGAHALRDPLFILPGHRRLAGGDVRLGIEGYLLDRVSLVERFINGVGSADDEARGIDLVELDGGVELGLSAAPLPIANRPTGTLTFRLVTVSKNCRRKSPRS